MKKFLILILSILSLTASAQKRSDDLQLRKFFFVENAISQLYVDNIDETKLVEDAIAGMLKELDPHSTYTPAKEAKTMTENLNGSFEGIGVQYNMNEDTLVVINTISNGPSEKVGIIAGDKIIAVNDTAIAGVKMTKEEIMKRLRGPKGTKVNLGVIRQGVKGVQKFTVVRDKIPVHTLDAYYMIDATTGYVKLSSFGATTHDEFASAVKDMQSIGMKDLVIDLQSNGGGYLQAAVAMADELLKDGEMIVYTDGRSTGRHDYHATDTSLGVGKVVVLVDGYTASAAEIVSGAIQDNDRGTIVGRRTFAKGLVQRPIDLPDGSMVRLTVAHFYSPVGRCFQKPYVKGDKKSYDNDMLERLNSGELMSADSIHFPDSLKYTTKGGRIVYGGGGIMPDVYVPLDTMQYTSLHRELNAKSCIIQTTLKYLDLNRKRLIKDYDVASYRKQLSLKESGKSYDVGQILHHAGYERFKQSFQIPNDMIETLLQKAKEAKIEYSDSVLKASLPYIKVQLKALLARDIWDLSEYYQIMNPSSEIYMAGLKALKD